MVEGGEGGGGATGCPTLSYSCCSLGQVLLDGANYHLLNAGAYQWRGRCASSCSYFFCCYSFPRCFPWPVVMCGYTMIADGWTPTWLWRLYSIIRWIFGSRSCRSAVEASTEQIELTSHFSLIYGFTKVNFSENISSRSFYLFIPFIVLNFSSNCFFFYVLFKLLLC